MKTRKGSNMDRLGRISLAGIVVLASCGFCSAATIVVNPTGRGDFKAIQPAVDAAVDGDTLLLSDGIYTGARNRNIDLQGKALTIKSRNGSDATVIDCMGAAECGFILPSHNYDVVLSGLSIQHATDAAVYCGQFTDVQIENCNLSQNGFGVRNLLFSIISVSDSSITENSFNGIYCHMGSLAMEDCSVTSNGDDGIFVDDDSFADITNCIVKKNKGCGLYFRQSFADVVNCAITGNQGDGIVTTESLSYLVNCTVAANLKSGIVVSSFGSLDLKNCILWGNGQGSIVIEYYPYGRPTVAVSFSCIQGDPVWPGEGNIALDPLFQSSFRLLPGSPAIDAGTLDGAPTTDLTGNPRPIGMGIDMGAYEARRSYPTAEELELE